MAATGRADAQEREALPEGNAYVRAALTSGPRSQDAAINDYSYDLEELRENLDKNGVATSHETRRYEVYFVATRPVRRLISRNGAPLSAKEQAEVNRKAAELAKDIAAGKTVHEQAGIRLSSLIDTFDFRTITREDHGGRKTLVFEFVPRKGSAPKASAGRAADAVAGILTGRVHIDETDRRVVRFEGHTMEGQKASVATGVKIGFLDLSMEFTPVQERVWLPKKVATVATGRAFLFKSFRIRSTTTYTNYRRFKVETEEKPIG